MEVWGVGCLKGGEGIKIEGCHTLMFFFLSLKSLDTSLNIKTQIINVLIAISILRLVFRIG